MGRRRQPRKLILCLVVLALVVVAYAVWTGFRYYQLESRINGALLLAAPDGTLTSAGTNAIIAIGESAVPVILQWSSGKEPAWYSISERVFRKLGRKAPGANRWERKEKARYVAHILQSKAKGAVPALQMRLNDLDPDVRRFSVHILGAIGPGIGPEAFKQMTNRLQDTEDNVRNDVVWALQFHNVHAYPLDALLPVFIAGLKDPFQITRENAEIGLNRLRMRDSETRQRIRTELLKNGLYPGPVDGTNGTSQSE